MLVFCRIGTIACKNVERRRPRLREVGYSYFGF